MAIKLLLMSGSPSVVTFAPTFREYPGSNGFWNMSGGRDAPPMSKGVVETPNAQPTISMCTVLMGIIVFLVVFYLLSFTGGPCERYRQQFVNGMRAAVKGKAPAPASAKKDVHLKVDDELARTAVCRPGDSSCVTNLTECTGDECADVKNVDPKYRSDADKKVMDFLKANKTAMIMIFAPWCPHCHTAMPKFFEAAKKSKCAFAIINAELVSPTMLQGENAVFNVQFFPFIVRREQKGSDVSDTVYKGAPSVEGLSKWAEMDQMAHFFG